MLLRRELRPCRSRRPKIPVDTDFSTGHRSPVLREPLVSGDCERMGIISKRGKHQLTVHRIYQERPSGSSPALPTNYRPECCLACIARDRDRFHLPENTSKPYVRSDNNTTHHRENPCTCEGQRSAYSAKRKGCSSANSPRFEPHHTEDYREHIREHERNNNSWPDPNVVIEPFLKAILDDERPLDGRAGGDSKFNFHRTN